MHVEMSWVCWEGSGGRFGVVDETDGGDLCVLLNSGNDEDFIWLCDTGVLDVIV